MIIFLPLNTAVAASDGQVAIYKTGHGSNNEGKPIPRLDDAGENNVSITQEGA